MKKDKLIYWGATGLLALMMLGSASMYIFKYSDVAAIFSQLGYPVYIVYPLAIAKILGVIAILSKKSPTLKEWAYAGFFFEFLLAFSAHINTNDGEFGGAIIAMILLFISYFYDKKVFSKEPQTKDNALVTN